MKVLVLWADDRSSNLGVRVLADGMAKFAERAWNPTQIDFQDFARNASGFNLGKKAVLHDLLKRRGPITEFLREYDLVLDTGAGDSFADIYGLKRLLMMTYTQRAVRKIGCPLVFGPQTIGPFNTTIGKAIARSTLSRASAVVVRDPQSLDYAANLGLKTAELATDVVFLLPTPTVEKTRDVILNISGLLWFDNPHVNHGVYRSQLRTLVSELNDEGRDVSIVTHVLANESSDNDVAAAEAFIREGFPNVELIVPDSLPSVREALASARAVVGSRMHACLNALSCGVPAVPWAYSRKFAPLLSDLGWSHTLDLRSGSDLLVSRTLQILGKWREEYPSSELDSLRSSADDRLKRAIDRASALV